MKSIYLVGFMGSGKTSVGKALANELQQIFMDTDDIIETRANKPIKSIFADEGEAFFRKLEHEVLLETPTNGFVIATGGGMIELDENRKWLLDRQVIYLKASWETIKDRLKHDESRPIWQDEGRDKKQLLLSREEKYQEVASITIDTGDLSIQKIVDKIVAELV